MFQKLNELKKQKSAPAGRADMSSSVAGSAEPPPPPSGASNPDSPNPFDSFTPVGKGQGQKDGEKVMSIPTGTPDRKEVLQRMIQEVSDIYIYIYIIYVVLARECVCLCVSNPNPVITSVRISDSRSVVINLALKEIAKFLVKFEKHPNAASASRALTMKITAAQFLNTAMIGLLMNTQLNQRHKDFFGYEGTVFENYGLLDGAYQDFYREWFATVGRPLFLTMIVNIIVPHFGPFAKGIFARPAKIKVLRKHAATKVEMDELYAMDRFEIETRYGALLNYLMVSVLYAAGMPMMFFLGSANFFIR